MLYKSTPCAGPIEAPMGNQYTIMMILYDGRPNAIHYTGGSWRWINSATRIRSAAWNEISVLTPVTVGEGAEEIWMKYIKDAPGPKDKPIVDSKMVLAAMHEYAQSQLTEAKQENERLRGLVHKVWNLQYPHPESVQDKWQQFKTENNL